MSTGQVGRCLGCSCPSHGRQLIGFDGVEDLDDVERKLSDEERQSHDESYTGHRATWMLHRCLATSSVH